MCVIFLFLWRRTSQEQRNTKVRLQKTLEELRNSYENSQRLEHEISVAKQETTQRDVRLRGIEKNLERYFPESLKHSLNLTDAEWGWRANYIEQFIRKRQQGLGIPQPEYKSNKQIGLEYELSVAHEYRLHGYDIDLHGSRLGHQDMGIDLIAKRDNKTVLIQCKYWSRNKSIRENVVFQLRGSLDFYLARNQNLHGQVQARLVTNIFLSETAREVAKVLGIACCEGHDRVIFPAVKCMVRLNKGKEERLFYFPADAEYADMQLNESHGDCWAYDEADARRKGFQRQGDAMPIVFKDEHPEYKKIVRQGENRLIDLAYEFRIRLFERKQSQKIAGMERLLTEYKRTLSSLEHAARISDWDVDFLQENIQRLMDSYQADLESL